METIHSLTQDDQPLQPGSNLPFTTKQSFPYMLLQFIVEKIIVPELDFFTYKPIQTTQ